MKAPGRLAAAPRGGTEPDRETRIGFGPRRAAPLPLAACGGLSPRGRVMQRGSRDARRSNSDEAPKRQV